MRRVLSVLGILVAGYLIVVGALYIFQRNLLYLPDRSTPDRQASGLGEMSEVRIRTADGLDLLAWYRPAAALEREAAPTIVYLHGNGGHIGYRGSRVRPYLDAGFGVLLVEYRGYGGNPGQPSEPGLALDARAAMAFLAAAGVAPQRTVVYGESLGATVAVALAADQAASGHPVGAVVLEAPPSSIVDVAAYHYPWVPVRWLLADRFEATPRIAAIDCAAADRARRGRSGRAGAVRACAVCGGGGSQGGRLDHRRPPREPRRIRSATPGVRLSGPDVRRQDQANALKAMMVKVSFTPARSGSAR